MAAGMKNETEYMYTASAATGELEETVTYGKCTVPVLPLSHTLYICLSLSLSLTLSLRQLSITGHH